PVNVRPNHSLLSWCQLPCFRDVPFAAHVRHWSPAHPLGSLTKAANEVSDHAINVEKNTLHRRPLPNVALAGSEPGGAVSVAFPDADSTAVGAPAVEVRIHADRDQ